MFGFTKLQQAAEIVTNLNDLTHECNDIRPKIGLDSMTGSHVAALMQRILADNLSDLLNSF